MAPESRNPFRDLAPEKRAELLDVFLELKLGDENDFEKQLQRGAATHERMAKRTLSERESDIAGAKRLLDAIFGGEDNGPTPA